MSKKSRILFIVIFTILSLVIIIGMYYGIDRYLLLRMSSNNKAQNLINNYSKLTPSSDDRTVVTFASTDDHNILPTVMSLLDQTVRVNQIALNSCLKKQPSDTCLQAINVFRVSPKLEQFRGIVPTLEREKSAQTNIIWLRDDYIYGKDFIETLIDTLKKPTQAVIAKDSKGNIIGILLKPDALDTSILNYEKYCDQKSKDINCNTIEKIQEYLIEKPIVIMHTDSYKL